MSLRIFNADAEPASVRMSDLESLRVVQPFPMQGSKRKQAPLIGALFPSDVTKVVEPFCGSAAVSLALRAGGYSGEMVINDKSSHIAALWNVIISDPERLAHEYRVVWEAQFLAENEALSSREYFNTVRTRFNNGSEKSPADFLFILNRIVKGALRYNNNGEINQSADGRRVGARPEVTGSRIMSVHHLMKNTEVRCADWLDCVQNLDPKAYVYLDPPYQGTTDTSDKRYWAGLSYTDFLEGVRLIIRKGVSAAISYDAIRGPVRYGRALHLDADLYPLDVITGVSSQGTLFGRHQEAHETLYLTPALVERLGGVAGVNERVVPSTPLTLFDPLAG